MQNQNELKCEGCGQQFSNRNDLDKHRQSCAAVKAQGGSGQSQGQNKGQGSTGSQQQGGSQQQPRTQGAGGGQNPKY